MNTHGSNNEISSKVLKNTAWNVFGRVWGFLIAIFLTPYIVRKIGIEKYGIYALVSAAGSYLSLLDFGVGNSFVKYEAEFYARREYGSINTLANTGAVFYLFFGIFLCLLLAVFTKPILVFLSISPGLFYEVKWVLYISVAILGFSSLLSPFTSLLGGLQRMDVSNKINVSMALANLAGVVFFLEKGYGLLGLMANSFIIFALGSGLALAAAFNILPELRLNPLLFERSMFSKIFNYGYKLQITRLSSAISSHFEKFLITGFLSVSHVTFYQLGNSAAEQAKTLPMLLTGALYPAFSELDARSEKEKIKEIYIRGTKYITIISAPVFMALSLLAFPAVLAWMGPGYDRAGIVLRIMAAGLLINTVLGGVGAPLAQGVGKPEIQMKGALVNMILNLGLSFLLILKLGFLGAAMGTSFSMAAAACYFSFLLSRELNLPFPEFFEKALYKPFLAASAASFSLGVFAGFFNYDNLPPSRLSGIKALAGGSLLFSVVYLAVLFFIKPFDRKDKEIFSRGNRLAGKMLGYFS